MPKQISITKEMIDQTAFELVRTQGMAALTARSIAQLMGCSTQPIYSIYRNLDALREHVVCLVANYADEMILHYDKTAIPFLNTGLGFIHFASTEKVLFRIFNIENYLNRPVFGPLESEKLYHLMEELLGDAPLNQEERKELFLNIMVYANGLAHMAYSGQLDMTEMQTAEHLSGVFFRLAKIEWNGSLEP